MRGMRAASRSKHACRATRRTSEPFGEPGGRVKAMLPAKVVDRHHRARYSALTPDEEANLVSCLVAKHLGVRNIDGYNTEVARRNSIEQFDEDVAQERIRVRRPHGENRCPAVVPACDARVRGDQVRQSRVRRPRNRVGHPAR